MKNAANKGTFANFALHFVGFCLCIIPPLVCALSYFPLWKNAGYETCIAGGGAILLILCFMPMIKFLSKIIKSYSAYLIWLICFLLFLALSKIADQMTVISFVGFVGNALGALCFKLAERRNNA